MNKISGLEKRIAQLETSHRRDKTVEDMSENELLRIIGINDPSNDELMRIAGGDL